MFITQKNLDALVTEKARALLQQQEYESKLDVITEPAEIITRPGLPLTILQHTPRSPRWLGGYIDFGGMEGSDTIELKIEMKLTKDSKWRLYTTMDFSGVQKEAMFFLRDLLVVYSIKISLLQKEGIGKKLKHVWYRRK